MSDFARETDYIFRPHRGKEDTIKLQQKNGGYMYYATDTHRMYFDLDENTRQGVRSEGVIFVYGTAYTADNKPDGTEDIFFVEEKPNAEDIYLYPRTKIEGHWNPDDIIISLTDGSFYKIIGIESTDENYVQCELLMVAGSGAGKTGLHLIENQVFPGELAYGQKATARFTPKSYDGHTSGNIYISLYRDENANQPVWTTRYAGVRMNEAIDVTIPAEELAAGDKNYIVVILRTTDGKESVPYPYNINCIDLKFELDQSWDYSAIYSVEKEVVVPWRASAQISKVSADLKINVDWTCGDLAYETESYEFKNNVVQSRNFSDYFKEMPHGVYRIQAVANVVINNTKVTVGTIDIEVPWLVEGEEVPLIWSKYPTNSIVPKFTLIAIEYKVYDPISVKEGKTAVKTYLTINGTLVEEEGRDIPMVNTIASDTWDVADYQEGDNILTITCRQTIKSFYINVVPNPEMQLDPISTGCVLWLNAKGRSNNVSETRRLSWPNKVNVPSTSFTAEAIPQLTGFNWYNNGWLKDSEGNNILRLSNGAKVEIPIQDLRSFQDRTYEFDFKVHNAINFSKLINITTVLDEDGNPVIIEDPLSGNEYEQVEKTVSSGEGAFLKYYDTAAGQGYMLGTQEAFFSYSAKNVANVRYADDTRVKVSFVVRYAERSETTSGNVTTVIPEEKYIYLYVDGVLTAAYPITESQVYMNSTATKIEINSDYCDVDIYNIRIYDTALDYGGIVTNWIGDSSTLQVMTEKYERNNLTVGSGVKTTIDYEKAKNSGLIPVMVLTTYGDGSGGLSDLLPYKKGDKRMCGVRYYDPFDVSKSFHAYNCEIDVQGTSSQGYPRRNYKLKTKKYDDNFPFYFEKWDGVEENKDDWVSYAEDASEADKAKQLKKWDLGHGVKETTFCLKADYMESSSSHNTGLANLVADIQSKYSDKDTYDFRHPLTRQHNEKSRTTIYGYPILVFHEQKVVKDGVTTTPITFVGKYNFNIDKGATDSFGFTSGTTNQYSESIYPEYVECKVNDKKGMYPVNLVPNETGDGYKYDEATGALLFYHPANNEETPLLDGDDKPVTKIGPGSYEQVSECWEFTQNQPGPGKFQEQQDGFYQTSDRSTNTKIIAADHFEMRYHYADFDDPYETEGSIPAANDTFKRYTKNFAKMWEWVASTDVSANAIDLAATGKGKLNSALTDDQVKRYHTRDTEYDSAHKYYLNQNDEEAVKIVTENVVTMADSDIVFDGTILSEKLIEANAALGDYSISWDAETSAWQLWYTLVTETETKLTCVVESLDLTEWGITLPEKWGEATILFSYTEEATNWNANLYQEFTHDTIEYRLAKFRDEFSQHFNLAHVAFYYIITEVLLLYDSRQKNMMIASWGPETKGGEYIWYPIFYDMDTQLGINNSGQIYWDYDTDATPKDNPDASIFSGTGSVLWANFATCFENEIKLAYRLLRQYSDRLSLDTLQKAYNTNQSDKWSEQMKNIDAFYKYIAPTSKEYGGFINTDGDNVTSSTYVYCLQGDRKLNRNAFFRNRLNYMDSQWLGGNYDPTKMSTAITMRYNLNKTDTTSDRHESVVDNGTFKSDPDYKITPFLTQYVSVAYDQIAADPVRFDIAKVNSEDESTTYALIKAPETIKSRAEAGVTLTQQLAYVYGPQFISDLGDLSDKYLNIFQSEGATRLRNLQIGSDKPGYSNTQFKDLDTQENSASSDRAKTLLEKIDFSNLSALESSYDVSGCLKLKHFKALGTKLSSVAFAKGNLLEKVYLPATITSLALVAPLSLTNVITDTNRVNWVQNEDTTWTHNNDNGLYVENLTNKLDNEIVAGDGSYTAITYYQMDETKMGYDTYRMLEYLYRLKLAVQKTQVDIAALEAKGTILTPEQEALKTWANKTAGILRIQVTDAEWTPYEKVDIESAPAEPNSQLTYYELKNNMTYGVYDPEADGNDWTQDLKNKQLFTKVRGDSPATDLAMFDTFIKKFKDNTCVIGSATNPYYFRPIFNGPLDTPASNKLLPIITGNLHVNNTEDTAIDEIDLQNVYGATGYFDALTITANHVNPCYRAKFVEYDTSDTKVTHYVQRSKNENTIAEYAGDVPNRLYYDFLGWSLNTEKLKASQSVGTYEDLIIDAKGNLVNSDKHPVLTMDQKVDGEWVDNTLELVAVFQLTKYKITFIDGNGNPVICRTNEDGQLITYLEFSTREAIVPPKQIPYKNDMDLKPINMHYNFLGYSTSEVSDTVVTFGNIYPTRDMTYYAQFELVDIYEHPLPLEQLYYRFADDGSGVEVTLNGEYRRTGKVCIPKTLLINGYYYNVVGILGKSFTDSGQNDRESDFYCNTRLTHVFMQGTQDNTCTISAIGSEAFSMQKGDVITKSNLVHIDIPSSLTRLSSYAFYYCNKLAITNLKNIVRFNQYCLSNVGADSTITEDDMLYISGKVESIGAEAFRYSKWWKIQLGNAGNPLSSLTSVFTQDSYPFDMDWIQQSQLSQRATLFLFTTLDTTTAELQFGNINGQAALDLVVTTV